MLNKIYCYDPTHRENYDKVIEDIKLYYKAATYVPEFNTWYNMGSCNWYFFLPFSAVKNIVTKQRYCCEACARNDFVSWDHRNMIIIGEKI